MGARMVPANGQTTKTKKKLYMSFWLERLSILFTNIYICVQFLFSKRGGVLLLGTVLLLGHIQYIYMLWNSMHFTTKLRQCYNMYILKNITNEHVKYIFMVGAENYVFQRTKSVVIRQKFGQTIHAS